MNILHLSDIHFGRNYKCYGLKDKFDNKNEILNELISCIKNVGDFMPEHIIVTGDIAWHGKRKEYEEAQNWFERLLQALNLTGRDITFCVGNHDVNRAYASNHIKYTDDSIESIDEIYDYRNVHKLEPPIYEYDRFCEKMGVDPFYYPCRGKLEYSYSVGYKDVEFSSKNKIRLVAFNTALLSFSSSISQDRMWIGQKQIHTLMEYGIIPNKEVHYIIALFHHAERFLHPNEICEYDGRVATLNLLRKNVDLILCGHTETGGKPVLHQQLGGGKLLTAGAAYYSDTHPNAFSILCVPDNEKTVFVKPFTYQSGWKNYDLKEKDIKTDKLYELPILGEIKETCKFIVKAKDEKYEIPLKRITIYSYKKGEVTYVKIDNRKEVLRYLDIDCEGPINGGKINVPVTLAPKMEHSVRAMLERELYFAFLAKHLSDGNDMEFYIETASGDKVIYAKGFNCEADADDDEILLLKKLKKIEDYYDIRFYLPNEIFEKDLEKIDLLIELIECGYTKKIPLGNFVSTNFTDCDKLKLFYDKARKLNSFCLVCEDDFWCSLFDVKFSIGKVMIVAGRYHVDLKELKYKLDTFILEDSRKITFNALEDFHTYFIVDREKARNEIKIAPKYETFIVKNMGLKWGFIYENE